MLTAFGRPVVPIWAATSVARSEGFPCINVSQCLICLDLAWVLLYLVGELLLWPLLAYLFVLSLFEYFYCLVSLPSMLSLFVVELYCLKVWSNFV